MSDIERNDFLFEIDGYRVLDFEASDGENEVVFLFTLQTDEVPSLDTMPWIELIKNSGVEEILIQKKWFSADGFVLVPFTMNRKCVCVDPKTYTLSLTCTRKYTH